MISVARSSDPTVLEFLRRHPRVNAVEAGNGPGLEFLCGDQLRRVLVGDADAEVAGLVELIDNNPMVCADTVSVGDPLSTLSMVALGPIAWAGMIVERPTVISSFDGDEALVDDFLKTVGWNEGATVHVEPKDLGSVRALTAIAAILTPGDWNDVDDIYEERYGRSFFIRRDEDSDWDRALVHGKPYAKYRLRYSPDDMVSLLTISVLADAAGKCGAAQVVHAMNVMAGFEESLGVA